MLRKFSNLPIVVILIDSTISAELEQFCNQNDVKILLQSPFEGFDGYFPINKKYVSLIDSDSVLFIDCDTFVSGDVGKVFDFYQDLDFVACQNRWVYGHQYRDEFLKNSISPFNSGVMLFNHRSQQRIYEKFDQVFMELDAATTPLGHWLISSGNKWTIEEFAVSQCVTDLELKVKHFEREHCYNIQWPSDFDKISESVIFHSYTKQWKEAYKRLNQRTIKIPKRFKKISSR